MPCVERSGHQDQKPQILQLVELLLYNSWNYLYKIVEVIFPKKSTMMTL